MDNSILKKYEDIMKIGLGGLNAIDNEIIIRHGQYFEKGEYIINESENTKDIYLIIAGKVIVAKEVKTIKKVLATLGPGELIGEMSFFESMTRSASCIADSDVVVIVFTTDTFSEIYKVHPRWLEQILTSLSKRIINTLEILKAKT
jgi:CRP-like cAMP-binding protein